MSDVTRLMADEEVGYWEYQVNSPSGLWHIEATRGEKIDPDKANSVDPFDKFHLGLRLRLNGDEVFATQGYEPEELPFLCPYEVNSCILGAAIGTLAGWYQLTVLMREFGPVLDVFKEIGLEAILAVPDNNGELDTPGDEFGSGIREADLERLQPHGDSTNELHELLWRHGMESTTPEWRLIYMGKADPEWGSWGNDPNGKYGRDQGE